MPEQPISGSLTELNLPSELRAVRNRLSSNGWLSVLPCAAPDAYLSWRLLARSSVRIESRLRAPRKPGSLTWHELVNEIENDQYTLEEGRPETWWLHSAVKL